LIGSVTNRELEQWQGKRLSEIASAQNKDPLDALLDFIIADHGQTGAIFFMMSEDDMKAALKSPFVSICTDSGARATDGPLAGSKSHPRGWGTYPRILGRYVRDEKLMPLEFAIHKMTGLPASNVGLKQRGLLRQGYFADITIFDPKTVIDRCDVRRAESISRRHQLCDRERADRSRQLVSAHLSTQGECCAGRDMLAADERGLARITKSLFSFLLIGVYPRKSAVDFFLKRADDSSILVLSKRLQRLSTDASLRAESEHGLSVSLVVGRFYHGDQIISAHRQISILQLYAGLRESLTSSIESLSTISNVGDSLTRPLQKRNVSWHGFSFLLECAGKAKQRRRFRFVIE
jgi:hypothetical protein